MEGKELEETSNFKDQELLSEESGTNGAECCKKVSWS